MTEGVKSLRSDRDWRLVRGGLECSGRKNNRVGLWAWGGTMKDLYLLSFFFFFFF